MAPKLPSVRSTRRASLRRGPTPVPTMQPYPQPQPQQLFGRRGGLPRAVERVLPQREAMRGAPVIESPKVSPIDAARARIEQGKARDEALIRGVAQHNQLLLAVLGEIQGLRADMRNLAEAGSEPEVQEQHEEPQEVSDLAHSPDAEAPAEPVLEPTGSDSET